MEHTVLLYHVRCLSPNIKCPFMSTVAILCHPLRCVAVTRYAHSQCQAFICTCTYSLGFESEAACFSLVWVIMVSNKESGHPGHFCCPVPFRTPH